MCKICTSCGAECRANEVICGQCGKTLPKMAVSVANSPNNPTKPSSTFQNNSGLKPATNSRSMPAPGSQAGSPFGVPPLEPSKRTSGFKPAPVPAPVPAPALAPVSPFQTPSSFAAGAPMISSNMSSSAPPPSQLMPVQATAPAPMPVPMSSTNRPTLLAVQQHKAPDMSEINKRLDKLEGITTDLATRMGVIESKINEIIANLCPAQPPAESAPAPAADAPPAEDSTLPPQSDSPAGPPTDPSPPAQ